ncbi:MAG: ABC transporter ATP-binding protein [Bacteroidales bacterium]|nr:ABC transporter ATP-binding protein [Bacteroidales bacterium]
MRRLLKHMFRDWKWTLLAVALLIVVSTLCTLAMTLFTRTLIDGYILPLCEAADPDFSPLAVALAKLAAVLLVGVVASFLFNFLMIKVEQGIIRQLRTRAFGHLMSLPLRFFDSRPHGDVMSVFTNDMDTFRQMVGRTLPHLFSAAITLVSTLAGMIVLSIPLTGLSLLCAGGAMAVAAVMSKFSRKYFKGRQENMARVNGYIEEMVSGQKVVKVFNHEKEAVVGFSGLNEDLFRSVFKANRVANTVMPINAGIANLGYVLIAIVGAYISLSAGADVLTVGTLVSFLTLHKNFSRPIAQISQEVNNIAMASAGADRVYGLLDEIPEPDEGTVELEKSVISGGWCWKDGDRSVEQEGLVSLKDVDFGYVPGVQVLFDITLTAYPGQKIAFVGGTGAGKTTITNLINRFYDTSDGEITIDGINVRRIRKASLRRSLGIVLQETSLFTGTVMDNIRFGRLDATDEECIAAARLVHADSFIRRLPEGYATLIDGDGGSLSAGERQLLSIARTAVADPPVLILDEATSSIDTRTEKLIQKGMDGIMKGRTSFVIAHRLSTVRDADYIIVLEKGRIIEAGKHFELLERRGKYWELFTGGSIAQ